LAGLIFLGARRFPLWFATASTILISHSLIAHKEYRFIFPAVACYLVLAGIGTGDVVEWFYDSADRQYPIRRIMLAGIVACTVTSASLAVSKSFFWRWFQFTPEIHAMEYAGQLDNICGLGLHGVRWSDTPGTGALRHRVPIYQDGYPTVAEKPELERQYNVALSAPLSNLSSDFSKLRCFEAPLQKPVCVYSRAGNCSPDPEKDFNRWLVLHSQ
jgi:phosphatidylinositol glycan class B